jgi:hypothetical protein
MKGQYSVPSSTPASNNLYVGGQPQSHPASNDLYVGGQSQSHPASNKLYVGGQSQSYPTSNKLYVGGQSQRQDYGGPVWASAGTFQAVPSAGPQLPPSANYSGPTYIPNDFNNTIRYDPASSISSQLATATFPRTSYALSSREYDASDEITRNIASLSFSPQPRIQEQRTEDPQGLRDPSSPVANRYVSANNPKEQTERLDPRKLLDLNYHLLLLVTEIDRISCY